MSHLLRPETTPLWCLFVPWVLINVLIRLLFLRYEDWLHTNLSRATIVYVCIHCMMICFDVQFFVFCFLGFFLFFHVTKWGLFTVRKFPDIINRWHTIMYVCINICIYHIISLWICRNAPEPDGALVNANSIHCNHVPMKTMYFVGLTIFSLILQSFICCINLHMRTLVPEEGISNLVSSQISMLHLMYGKS